MTNKKILVVDDEIHIVHVIAIKLRRNGFEVITADNAQDALELAVRNCPDIVVTDFQMPEMTGMELVEKLRQQKETFSVPVIMLTARNLVVQDEQKEKLAISEFVSKPFSPKELLRTIEDLLHQAAVGKP